MLLSSDRTIFWDLKLILGSRLKQQLLLVINTDQTNNYTLSIIYHQLNLDMTKSCNSFNHWHGVNLIKWPALYLTLPDQMHILKNESKNTTSRGILMEKESIVIEINLRLAQGNKCQILQ